MRDLAGVVRAGLFVVSNVFSEGSCEGIMKKLLTGTGIVAQAGAIVAAAAGVADACAMCGLSPGDHAIHAFNTSVIFMLAGPYLTMLAIGGILYGAYRRSIRKQALPVAAKR
jgi:hypothetical protein